MFMFGENLCMTLSNTAIFNSLCLYYFFEKTYYYILIGDEAVETND